MVVPEGLRENSLAFQRQEPNRQEIESRKGGLKGN